MQILKICHNSGKKMIIPTNITQNLIWKSHHRRSTRFSPSKISITYI
jgi:hypothetical protein